MTAGLAVCEIRDMSRKPAATDPLDLPPSTPEFERQFRLAITQEDSENAIEALRRGLVAQRSQRNTQLAPLLDKGSPVLMTTGQPVMVPRDSYELVDDSTAQIRAAELILAYAHGYPVKRSASIEAKGFVPLDAMLASSPIFQQQLADAAHAAAGVNGRAKRAAVIEAEESE